MRKLRMFEFWYVLSSLSPIDRSSTMCVL